MRGYNSLSSYIIKSNSDRRHFSRQLEREATLPIHPQKKRGKSANLRKGEVIHERCVMPFLVHQSMNVAKVATIICQLKNYKNRGNEAALTSTKQQKT